MGAAVWVLKGMGVDLDEEDMTEEQNELTAEEKALQAEQQKEVSAEEKALSEESKVEEKVEIQEGNRVVVTMDDETFHGTVSRYIKKTGKWRIVKDDGTKVKVDPEQIKLEAAEETVVEESEKNITEEAKAEAKPVAVEKVEET